MTKYRKITKKLSIALRLLFPFRKLRTYVTYVASSIAHKYMRIKWKEVSTHYICCRVNSLIYLKYFLFFLYDVKT